MDPKFYTAALSLLCSPPRHWWVSWVSVCVCVEGNDSAATFESFKPRTAKLDREQCVSLLVLSCLLHPAGRMPTAAQVVFCLVALVLQRDGVAFIRGGAAGQWARGPAVTTTSPTSLSYIPEMIPPEIPSLYPLQYITPSAVFQFYLEVANRAVISAVIPYDSNDALAIFISEGVGGFFGGFAQRFISRIDGNKNKEGSELVSAGASGAYFGVAGAVRSLAYASGLSQLAVSLLALVSSFSVSEFIKIRSKSIEAQRTRTFSSSITMYDLMKFREPSLRDLMIFRDTGKLPSPRMPMMDGSKTTQVEVQADATQYTMLSILVPNGRSSNGPSGSTLRLEESVLIGAVCGLAGQLVRESRDREMESLRVAAGQRGRAGKARGDFVLTRLARSAVEGAAQLLTYQAARDYVREISPYFNKIELQPLVVRPPLVLHCHSSISSLTSHFLLSFFLLSRSRCRACCLLPPSRSPRGRARGLRTRWEGKPRCCRRSRRGWRNWRPRSITRVRGRRPSPAHDASATGALRSLFALNCALCCLFALVSVFLLVW